VLAEQGLLSKDGIEHQKRSLKEQSRALSDEMDRLGKEQARVDSWLKDHRETDANGKKKQVNVDSLGEPDEKVTSQLLSLIAENQSLEDCMYYLDKALQREVIDLFAFLKAVRSLGRDQFINRALGKKVVETRAAAGLQ